MAETGQKMLTGYKRFQWKEKGKKIRFSRFADWYSKYRLNDRVGRKTETEDLWWWGVNSGIASSLSWWFVPSGRNTSGQEYLLSFFLDVKFASLPEVIASSWKCGCLFWRSGHAAGLSPLTIPLHEWNGTFITFFLCNKNEWFVSSHYALNKLKGIDYFFCNQNSILAFTRYCW